VLEGAVGIASGVPVIDWNAINDGTPLSTSTSGSAGGASWVDSFLNGTGGGKAGPNAGLRIRLGGG
jgi:hypothetical protein